MFQKPILSVWLISPQRLELSGLQLRIAFPETFLLGALLLLSRTLYFSSKPSADDEVYFHVLGVSGWRQDLVCVALHIFSISMLYGLEYEWLWLKCPVGDVQRSLQFPRLRNGATSNLTIFGVPAIITDETSLNFNWMDERVNVWSFTQCIYASVIRNSENKNQIWGMNQVKGVTKLFSQWRWKLFPLISPSPAVLQMFLFPAFFFVVVLKDSKFWDPWQSLSVMPGWNSATHICSFCIRFTVQQRQDWGHRVKN